MTFTDGAILYAADLEAGLGDTGWVTSGIAIAAASGWTVNSYRLRRVGSRVTGVINVTNTAAITAGSDGNITDQDICTPPTAWRNGSGYSAPVRIDQAAVSTWLGRANSGSAIKITNGITGATLPAGTACQVFIDYYND